MSPVEMEVRAMGEALGRICGAVAGRDGAVMLVDRNVGPAGGARERFRPAGRGADRLTFGVDRLTFGVDRLVEPSTASSSRVHRVIDGLGGQVAHAGEATRRAHRLPPPRDGRTRCLGRPIDGGHGFVDVSGGATRGPGGLTREGDRPAHGEDGVVAGRDRAVDQRGGRCSASCGVGEPRGERVGGEVEDDVPKPIAAELREALPQDVLLRCIEPTAQPTLELMPQRLEPLLDGLVGRVREQPQPAAKDLAVQEVLLFRVGRDVQLFVQLGGHR